MQNTRQKVREGEESKPKLENIVNLACLNLEDAKISPKMQVKDKVIRLGKIAVDLRKRITKLEENVRLSTPPEVMEKIRDAAIEAGKKIEEVEEICAKVVNQVSQTWEALMDDEKSQKIEN